jgi:xanthine dehydrogenase accessory factor
VVSEETEAIKGLLAKEQRGARLVFIAGPAIGDIAVLDGKGVLLAGSLPAEIEADVTADALELMVRQQHRSLSYGEHEVFIESLNPPPRLIIFGAVHIGQSMTTLAHHLGYRVTVSDARPAFCTPERFPEADLLLVGWPDQLDLEFDDRTSVVILSHDRRFEDPLWPRLLNSPVPYIGAMGSKGTAARRKKRLLEAGFGEIEVNRIHGPIGLDIGADGPGEVAVAILAEMISARARPAEPLPLHGKTRSLRGE